MSAQATLLNRLSYYDGICVLEVLGLEMPMNLQINTTVWTLSLTPLSIKSSSESQHR